MQASLQFQMVRVFRVCKFHLKLKIHTRTQLQKYSLSFPLKAELIQEYTRDFTAAPGPGRERERRRQHLTQK